MEKESIAILGANGQDGFITAVLALEQGIKVTAFSRRDDPRFHELLNIFPNLTFVVEPTYLEISFLRDIFKKTRVDHCFHFASDHGPNGTMTPESDRISTTHSLCILLPRNLISLADELSFGLTLPASSRVFSGHLANQYGEVRITAESPLNPVDYYGEAKAQMLELAREGRKSGIRIHSPILFNHDSIFKRRGYVGWAMAEHLAHEYLRRNGTKLSTPNASLDISNSVDFCRYMLNSRNNSGSQSILSSGSGRSITSILASTQKYILGRTARQDSSAIEVSSQDLQPPAVLIGDKSEIGYEIFPTDSLEKALAVMTLATIYEIGGSMPNFPVHGFDALPETYRSFGPRDLHKLPPVNASD